MIEQPLVEHTIRAKVTEQGLLIPKDFLRNIDEVEIRQEQEMIVVIPMTPIDPILQLGTQPIVCEVNDASIHHDDYLYRS